MTTHFGANLTGISSNGGVTRYQAGQDEAPIHNPLAEAHTGLRIGGTFTRTNMETGDSVEHQSFGRHNVYDDQRAADAAAARGGSIAQTFDHSNGGTVMIEGGMRTSVANALRQGLIEIGNDGRPRDIQRGLDRQSSLSPETPEAVTLPPEGPSETPEAFDAAEYAAFEADIADLPQPVYDTTVSAAVAACLDGGSLANATARLAQESGMEPARAEEYVSNIYSMYRDTVLRAVIPEGVRNPDAFFEWCRNQRGLQDAISSLTVQRDVSKFKSMARQYSAYQARHAGVNG